MDYLKAGHSLDEFFNDFPTVPREQAEGYLEMTLVAADTALPATRHPQPSLSASGGTGPAQ